MNEIYGNEHRRLQQAFETVSLADRVQERIVLSEITDRDQAFIESRDMFFLTTIDHRGYPTCSYKGGTPGFLRVVDSKTIAFPSYDGNGMFLSMGNIKENNKIGMLLMDLETPHRVRIHGTASITSDDALLKEFNGAELVVRVNITEIFVNCPRYIHSYQRIKTSEYVPTSEFEHTKLPNWKRIDEIQDALPERDSKRIKELGTITSEVYEALVMKGEG